MDKKNFYILQSISKLLEAYQILSTDKVCYAADITSIHYLLGQTIRAYKIPAANVHISEKAYEMWQQLTSESIDKYWYRETVVCNKLDPGKRIPASSFTGSSKNSKKITLQRGDKFCFRDIFHVDHVIPVQLILKALTTIDPKDTDAITSTLNKMHLCKILKSEDRSMGRTQGRTLDFTETITNVYNAHNIILHQPNL